MNLTKIIWSAGTLLAAAVFIAAEHNAAAQSWQPTAGGDGPATASLKWESRVLKQPVSAEKSDADRPTAPRGAERSYRTARRLGYERGIFGPARPARSPAMVARHSARLAADEAPEEILPGATRYEPLAEQGAFAGDACGVSGGCGECGTCGVPDRGVCCDFGYECFDGRCDWWLKNLTVFGGGQGFKGPVDWGWNGNFGLHEGAGVSGPLGDPWGCGYQMGAKFVHSNFSGQPFTIPGTDRTQYFVTAGIFRRQLCRGIQWGVVWDYMHDRYYDTFDLHQLRGDIGFVIDEVHEIGFLGAFGVSNDTYFTGNTTLELDPTDMCALYLRRNFENGGDGRFWGGATGRGDGLIGADLWVPLGRGFALQNVINYKIPREGRAGGVAHADESWGLTIQLIWYPGQSALCQRGNPYRPLMKVSDNSLFMVDEVTP